MADIEHVVVLALENRSFDHMLGYLDHPSPDFDGLQDGRHVNPGWDGGPEVETSPDAKFVLPVDPDHSHDAVMEQLALDERGTPRNTGFVSAYERKARGLAVAQQEGLLGPVVMWFQARKARKKKPITGRGPLIMLSQPPEHVPVLSTLAKEFAVCTRWFASVPGETWPNRNFMHAATSDGETNIEPRFYTDRTIFEQLEAAGSDWHIYYNDTPQIWAFKKLWDSDERKAKWFHFKHFDQHVKDGTLPAYSFIEPNHRPPYHLVNDGPAVEKGDQSSNQHPGNNLVADELYDSYDTDEPVDFVRGEALIAQVYESLRANPELFAKTLFVITYDEHGGCYDHVPPPTDVPPPGDAKAFWAKALGWLWRRKAKHFDFRMLGLRVPTVIVSPLIDANTVPTTVFDHSAIPATVRKLFASSQPPLTGRDAWSATFDDVVNRADARTDLPDLSAYATVQPYVPHDELEHLLREPPPDQRVVPEYYDELVQLSDKVGRRLRMQRAMARNAPDEGAGTPPMWSVAPKRWRAHSVTDAFRDWSYQARGNRQK
jgi:phospholipase C